MKQKCPLCDKEFEDILKHISIRHNIGDLDEYKRKVKEKEEKDKKIMEWKEFLKKLDGRHKSGEINGEEYRSIRKKWEQEHNMKW
jgi:hypothetical protein